MPAAAVPPPRLQLQLLYPACLLHHHPPRLPLPSNAAVEQIGLPRRATAVELPLKSQRPPSSRSASLAAPPPSNSLTSFNAAVEQIGLPRRATIVLPCSATVGIPPSDTTSPRHGAAQPLGSLTVRSAGRPPSTSTPISLANCCTARTSPGQLRHGLEQCLQASSAQSIRLASSTHLCCTADGQNFYICYCNPTVRIPLQASSDVWMRSSHATFSRRCIIMRCLNQQQYQHHPHCHHLFDKTPHRDMIARFNVLLTAQVRAGDPERALLLFCHIHCDGASLDGYSFTPALTACAALASTACGLLVGRQLHALGVKNGSLSGHITGTALLDMYAKCDGECLDDAVQMFDEMKGPDRDVVTWNALLSCFIRHGRAATAVSAFRSMTMDEGVKASCFTLATLLKACGSLKARRLGEQVHASLVVIAGAWDSIVLGTALVDFYSECGLIEQAVQVFGHLACRKDATSYSALINGCVENRRYGEAFALLRKMVLTATTLTTVLSACSESCNIQYGKQIHCLAIRRGFTCSTLLCNALLDMYAKCGAIRNAHSVFELMTEKNVVSWTSIINAYGSHGLGTEAVRLFKEMDEGEWGRVSPNAVTFLSVLSACAHTGMVNEGWACFTSMRERHSLEPGPEHYACLIDLLGRAGRMEEVWELFMGMSRHATTAGVCVATLNACGACMDVEKGELVAGRLLELETESSAGIYVQVSNFYAAVGRWEKVEELRRVMKERGLRKGEGSSWVDVGCCEKVVTCH